MNHSPNEQPMARKAAATPRGVDTMSSFFADRAHNAELRDVEGRRDIDFAGGNAVIDVMRADELPERGQPLGDRLQAMLGTMRGEGTDILRDSLRAATAQ